MTLETREIFPILICSLVVGCVWQSSRVLTKIIGYCQRERDSEEEGKSGRGGEGRVFGDGSIRMKDITTPEIVGEEDGLDVGLLVGLRVGY